MQRPAGERGSEQQRGGWLAQQRSSAGAMRRGASAAVPRCCRFGIEMMRLLLTFISPTVSASASGGGAAPSSYAASSPQPSCIPHPEDLFNDAIGIPLGMPPLQGIPAKEADDEGGAVMTGGNAAAAAAMALLVIGISWALLTRERRRAPTEAEQSRGIAGTMQALGGGSPALRRQDDLIHGILVKFAARGSLSDVIVCLRAGADMELTSIDLGYTALQAAALYGHGNCVTELLRAGANADTQMADGTTALLLAVLGCGRGAPDGLSIIKQLMKSGARVDTMVTSPDGIKTCPLLLALETLDVEMCTVLLAAPEAVECRNGQGRDAVHLLSSRMASRDLDILLCTTQLVAGKLRGLRTRPDLNNSIVDIIGAVTPQGRVPTRVRGTGECVRVKTNNLSMFDRRAFALLSMALQELAFPVDRRDSLSYTPMHLAIESGCAPTVSMLIDAGAKLDAIDPVSMACSLESVLHYDQAEFPVLGFAIAKGRHIMREGRHGKGVSSSEYLAVIETLITSNSADLTNGQTFMQGNNVALRTGVLSVAALTANLDVVRRCIDAGCNVNELTSSETDQHARDVGMTPLMQLFDRANDNERCEESEVDTVCALLLEHGADPNAARADGATVLHLACGKGYPICVRRLLDHPDIDPDARDGPGPGGMTAWQMTATLATHQAWSPGQTGIPNIDESEGYYQRLHEVLRLRRGAHLLEAATAMALRSRAPPDVVARAFTMAAHDESEGEVATEQEELEEEVGEDEVATTELQPQVVIAQQSASQMEPQLEQFASMLASVCTLGFPRADARTALAASDGNVEQAIETLLAAQQCEPTPEPAPAPQHAEDVEALAGNVRRGHQCAVCKVVKTRAQFSVSQWKRRRRGGAKCKCCASSEPLKAPVVDLVHAGKVGSRTAERRQTGWMAFPDRECPMCMDFEWDDPSRKAELAVFMICGHLACLACMQRYQQASKTTFPDAINATGTAQMTFACPQCRRSLSGCPDLTERTLVTNGRAE